MPVLLIGWRAVLLLLMAVAPWGSPREATIAPDLRAQMGLGFAGLIVVVAVIVRRIETHSLRDRIAQLLIGSVGLSILAAATLPRHGVPLSVASIVVALPVWMCVFLAVKTHFVGSKTLPSLVIVLAIVMWAIGGERVLDRTRVWRGVVLQNPSWAPAHLALIGRLQTLRASDNEVEAAAQECARLCPRELFCHQTLVRIALKTHAWEKVLTASRAGLLVTSADGELLRAQSAALHGLERHDDQSLVALRAAVDASPLDQASRVHLVSALQIAGQPREALAILNGGSVSNDIVTQQSLSALAIQAENWPVARIAVDRVLALDAENAVGRLNLGVLEQQAGHFNQAREAYLRALRTDPRNFSARYNLARLVFSVGATDEALHHAQRLIEIDARDPRVRTLVREIQDRVFATTSDGGVPAN